MQDFTAKIAAAATALWSFFGFAASSMNNWLNEYQTSFFVLGSVVGTVGVVHLIWHRTQDIRVRKEDQRIEKGRIRRKYGKKDED